MHDYVVFHRSIDNSDELIAIDGNLCENCSHFNTEMITIKILLGQCVSWRRTTNAKHSSFVKFESASYKLYMKSLSMPLNIVHDWVCNNLQFPLMLNLVSVHDGNLLAPSC